MSSTTATVDTSQTTTLTEVELVIIKRLTLTTGRVLVSKPWIAENTDLHRLASGLYAPGRLRRYTEYGMRCEVLSVGKDVPDEITPGVSIILPEYAGTPVNLNNQGETQLWIIGWGDAMAIVEDEADDAVAA